MQFLKQFLLKLIRFCFVVIKFSNFLVHASLKPLAAVLGIESGRASVKPMTRITHSHGELFSFKVLNFVGQELRAELRGARTLPNRFQVQHESSFVV